MQMPEMDGVALAKAIKTTHPQLPIMLLSSIGDERRKHYPELFSSVLTKPVKQQQFCQMLQSELRHQQRPTEVVSQPTLSADFAQRYPLKILLAEDNLINQKLAVRVLNKLGYEPELANNGVEVLEKVSQQTYEVILMDVQMPEMDGLEATRLLRQSYPGSGLVIIAMTANAMQGDKEDCLSAGMNDYLSKPLKLETLMSLLEKTALQLQASG
jgi:CheY-like chemotaxis protein